MTNAALLTIAEHSGFRETGRIDEVERLSSEFARAWPLAVRSFGYGQSAERRIMRALLITRTGALTAADIRARKIPLLMLQGGIHPGESDGKDAGFIELRELLEISAASTMLERIAILFVPAFNTDGHERFGRWNRPNQNGPEQTGWRTTSQNVNLNRDYTKADAPEMRAMLRLIDEFDPLVCADLHVTDGADFERPKDLDGSKTRIGRMPRPRGSAAPRPHSITPPVGANLPGRAAQRSAATRPPPRA